MAKAKTLSDLSPETFGLAVEFTSALAAAVVETQGYVVGETCPQVCIRPHDFPGYVVPPPISATESFTFEVYVPSWAESVGVTAAVDDNGATSVDVDVTVGGDSDTIALSSPWVGNVTLTASTVGSGVVTVTVSGTSTGGSGATLEWIVVRMLPLAAADLPDPA